MKKILVLSFVLTFCASGLFAALKKPGVIREKVSVPSAESVEDAINKACSGDNWKAVKLNGHNVIFATVDANECILTAKITYTKQNYVIEYRESNLDLDDEDDNAVINSTYDNKIAELNTSILKNLRG
ncbi:MAG: hypothetical protein FWD54_03245 [Endomicrobia bacterium]|nr:hypothetical protein [Endomicrobiia bacterium]MCL2799278.1 hypothetical protein [Endomicrobiia bacterium]